MDNLAVFSSYSERVVSYAALLVLGYTQAEAFAAMEGCPADGASAEDMIRYCLKRLAGGK